MVTKQVVGAFVIRIHRYERLVVLELSGRFAVDARLQGDWGSANRETGSAICIHRLP